MSPIQNLQLGISTGKWEFVCEAYSQLTGADLPLPPSRSPEADAFREIAEIIRRFDSGRAAPVEQAQADQVIASVEADREEVFPLKAEEPTFEIKKAPPKQSSKNLFVDDGTLAVEDIPGSQALSKKKEPEPRRPPVKMVEVTCVRCKNPYKVSSAFAPKGMDKDDKSQYTCDNCLHLRGRDA